jgi:hypothetical protein
VTPTGCGPGAREAHGADRCFAEQQHPSDTTRRSSALEAPADLSEIRFRRAVEQFHRLGGRALAELLAEIGAKFLIRQSIEDAVAGYVARLDPELLRVVGGDRFPPIPPPRLIVNRGRIRGRPRPMGPRSTSLHFTSEPRRGACGISQAGSVTPARRCCLARPSKTERRPGG